MNDEIRFILAREKKKRENSLRTLSRKERESTFLDKLKSPVNHSFPPDSLVTRAPIVTDRSVILSYPIFLRCCFPPHSGTVTRSFTIRVRFELQLSSESSGHATCLNATRNYSQEMKTWQSERYKSKSRVHTRGKEDSQVRKFRKLWSLQDICVERILLICIMQSFLSDEIHCKGMKI